MEKQYPGQGDPWGDFLHYRMKLIMVWMEEGKTVDEIAEILSMTSLQVWMIHQAQLPRLP